jgi:sulfite oxidase
MLTSSSTPAVTSTAAAASLLTPCAPAAILVPTLPAVIPGYTELDPSTNLHMTGKYQLIDLPSYRLEITGKVAHPLLFSFDDLRCLPKVTQQLVLDCPGYFSDEATWSGVLIDDLLKQAVVQPHSFGIHLVSADGYFASVPLEDVRAFKAFLAYEWEGQPLPILHGFPVRAVFPGMSGGRWVKWLVKIEVY